MKTILIVFLAAFGLFSITIAQNAVALGVGYNMSFMKLESLNSFFDDYNENREWLDKEMGNFSHPYGLVFSMTTIRGAFIYEVSINVRKQKRSAHGTNPANSLDVQRDIKFKMNTFEMFFGGAIPAGDYMAFVPGAQVEFGTLKAKTRVEEKSKIREEDFDQTIKEMQIYAGFSVQCLFGNISENGIYFGIVPFYNFAVANVDFAPLTSQMDPSSPVEVLVKNRHFGIKFMINFVPGG